MPRYHIFATPKNCRARCECGWESRPYSCGGLAGAEWDEHQEAGCPAAERTLQAAS